MGVPIANKEDIVPSFAPSIDVTEVTPTLGSIAYLYMPSYGTIGITVGPSLSLTYAQAVTTNATDYYLLTKNKNGPVQHTDSWINPDKPILEGIYDVPDDQDLVATVDDAGQEGEWSAQEESSVTGVGEDLPEADALHGNVPNPFNPLTVLHYDLPKASRVSLAIYDISGARVCVLRNNVLEPADHHEDVWDGSNDSGMRVASGVYFCKMEAGTFRATQRMMLVK